MTANALRDRLIATMTEADLQNRIVTEARLRGWKVAHFRPGRTRDGWRTTVAYDGAGWPDLVLVRDRLIVAELKSEKGRVTPEQRRWLSAIENAHVPAYVWRPSDWERIKAVLT